MLHLGEIGFDLDQRKILLKKLKSFQEDGFLEESVKVLLESRIEDAEETIARFSAQKMLMEMMVKFGKEFNK